MRRSGAVSMASRSRRARTQRCSRACRRETTASLRKQSMRPATSSSGVGPVSWTIDSIAPPPAVIGGGPTGSVASTSASFTFVRTETPQGVDCRLRSGAAFATCNSPKTYNNLSQGQHTFEGRLTDQAGNAAFTTRVWIVDTVAPASPSLDTGPTGLGPPTATFTFSHGETGNGVPVQPRFGRHSPTAPPPRRTRR